MRLIDADALIKNLEGIISDYTSNGFYPSFIDVCDLDNHVICDADEEGCSKFKPIEEEQQ